MPRSLSRIIHNAKKNRRIANGLVLCDLCDNPASLSSLSRAMSVEVFMLNHDLQLFGAKSALDARKPFPIHAHLHESTGVVGTGPTNQRSAKQVSVDVLNVNVRDRMLPSRIPCDGNPIDAWSPKVFFGPNQKPQRILTA